MMERQGVRRGTIAGAGTQLALAGSAKKGWADWFGIGCAVGCMIHCIATPLGLGLLSILPALSDGLDGWVHQGFSILAVVLVAFAIRPSARSPRKRDAVSLAGGGILLLLAAAFILPADCCGVPSVGESDRGATLMTATTMIDMLGYRTASMVMASQPFLSPLGGLLLIAAHWLNLQIPPRTSGFPT